jgi:hypothetical protein
LRNDPGVSAVSSLAERARDIGATLAAGNPRFAVLPRGKYALAQAIAPLTPMSGLFNADCSAMALLVYTRSADPQLLQGLAATVAAFDADNAARSFATGEGGDAAYCEDKLAARAAWGEARAALRAVPVEPPAAEAKLRAARLAVEAARARFESMARACPVRFAVGSGPLAVQLADHESLQPAPLLGWLCLALALLAVLARGEPRDAPAALVPAALVGALTLAALAVADIPISPLSLPVPGLCALLAAAAGLQVALLLDGTRRDVAALLPVARAVLGWSAGLAIALLSFLAAPLRWQADLAGVFAGALIATALVVLLLVPALRALGYDSSGSA